MNSHHAARLRGELSDPKRVLRALGLLDRTAQPQAGGYLIRCPSHEDGTPSCSVTRAADGTLRCRCFGCGWTGDVLSLVAVVRGLDVKTGFREILCEAAKLARDWTIAAQLEAHANGHVDSRPDGQRPSNREALNRTERTYPDRAELEQLLTACCRVDEDPQVCAYLRSRGLDPQEVSVRGLALALPASSKGLARWARFRGRPWVETGHRCILQAFDARGAIRSVRACRLVDNDTPKRLPPAGHKAAGLVLLDSMGQDAFRAGGWPSYAKTRPRFVIAEGEPDFLSLAVQTPLYQTPRHAVIGICSGSWTSDVAQAIPDGAEVVVWTHRDSAGEAYAEKIARSLGDRCNVLRGAL